MATVQQGSTPAPGLAKPSEAFSALTGSAGAGPGEADAYFSELLGYSMDRLSKEPELLRAEQEQLRRQAQETAAVHYRSFVDSARCAAALRERLGASAAQLDSLLSRDLPALAAAGDGFRRDAAAINAARADNRQLYSNHSALLEVLEVPQLMDTCIRNGNFDEALDLRAFVNKVCMMHGELGVVRRLVGEVDAVAAAMLETLLARLQANVTLPECLRVIGYLRRLAAFQERELRLQFLQRREAWIAELVGELELLPPYERIKRLTDVYRLNLFDVVMQYRAIFSDEAPAAPAPGAGGAAAAAAARARPPGSQDGGILYEWAGRRVGAYLEAVAGALPSVGEGGSLASVLDHAMYCGMALGRVGLDFRPLLAPLFEDAALRLFTRGVAASTEAFGPLLEAHKWAALPLGAAARRPGGEAAAGGGAGTAPAADSAAPPAALMEHPPLAAYANGVLAALNELRHCAPLSLRDRAAAAVGASLAAVAASLEQYGSTRPLGDAERPVFDGACRALGTLLLPYLASCLDRIYPGASLLIDSRAVTAPLADLAALARDPLGPLPA